MCSDRTTANSRKAGNRSVRSNVLAGFAPTLFQAIPEIMRPKFNCIPCRAAGHRPNERCTGSIFSRGRGRKWLLADRIQLVPSRFDRFETRRCYFTTRRCCFEFAHAMFFLFLERIKQLTRDKRRKISLNDGIQIKENLIYSFKLKN